MLQSLKLALALLCQPFGVIGLTFMMFLGCMGQPPWWMALFGLPFFLLALLLVRPRGDRADAGFERFVRLAIKTLTLTGLAATFALTAFCVAHDLRAYGTLLFADCGGPTQHEHVALACRSAP